MNTTLLHTITKDLDFSSEISENDFWTDDHISKMLLKQQLDPTYEGGSKLYSEIFETVDFISKNIEISKCNTLIDLGCGPGLYSSLFCKYIKSVIGIDISQTSINYAMNIAKNNKLNIEYILCDIIKMRKFPKADIILLVYSIFGSLTSEKREELITKINKSLPMNGYFIFDVFSDNAFLNQESKTDWCFEDSGFWSPLPYLLLKQTLINSMSKEILHRYIVIGESCNIKSFTFREKYFDLIEIKSFLKSFGFRINQSLGSLTGKSISNKTKEIAIIARKSNNIT